MPMEEDKEHEEANTGKQQTTHHRHRDKQIFNLKIGQRILKSRFGNGCYSCSGCGSSSSGAFDGSRFDEVIVTSFFLEKLSEMVLAVQNSLKSCIV